MWQQNSILTVLSAPLGQVDAENSRCVPQHGRMLILVGDFSIEAGGEVEGVMAARRAGRAEERVVLGADETSEIELGRGIYLGVLKLAWGQVLCTGQIRALEQCSVEHGILEICSGKIGILAIGIV